MAAFAWVRFAQGLGAARQLPRIWSLASPCSVAPAEEAHDKFIDVVFMCESDDKKAAHLRSLHSKVPIFKDVGDMGVRVGEGVA